MADKARMSAEYRQHMASPAWRTTRKAAIARAGRRCQRCGATDLGVRLEVHHTTYERLGRERPEDLLVLCPPCHGRADEERAIDGRKRSARALSAARGDARVEGWARACFGDDAYDWPEDYAERFDDWLERRGE